MRAELANLNDCAVPFLNRAAINMSRYDTILCTMYIVNVHDTFVSSDNGSSCCWLRSLHVVHVRVYCPDRTIQR